MQPREYERLAATEERMWWFRGLHANLIDAWRRRGASPAPSEPRLLDAGCGTGGLLARLRTTVPEARLYGLDRDAGACAMASAKSDRPIVAGSIDALPFADDAFDAAFSADVLCHGGVDEAAALAGLRRCLKPGGILVLNLPAYRWLFSAHDLAVDNVRRYGRGEVRRLLATAGFVRITVDYWNSLLFPLMLARRLVARHGGDAASDVALLPAPVERLFGAIVAFELTLAGLGARLPFGGSLLAVAAKP
jgi:SAM-dependent methyltransferase